MPNFTAISKETFANKSWAKFGSYQFAAKDHLVPVVGAEISRAVLSLPMAFIKQQGKFSLVAGLSQGTLCCELSYVARGNYKPV